MTPTVQIAMSDAAYAGRLREALERDGAFRDWKVWCAETPDPEQKGVIVLDANALERLAFPLPSPERVVLITCKDPYQLSRAWNAGIASVVFDDAPLSTVMLAILAAWFRASRSQPEVRR